MRWKHGLPEVLKLYSVLLWLVVLIDTALTPFVLPLVIFAFYRDEKEVLLPRRFCVLATLIPTFVFSSMNNSASHKS